jgi:hypothetical protein
MPKKSQRKSSSKSSAQDFQFPSTSKGPNTEADQVGEAATEKESVDNVQQFILDQSQLPAS